MNEIQNENNMNTFGGSFVTLYFLTSLSNYPSAIIPYCKVSNFFFLYFFPFIYVILLFFIPIPVAVVFDRFRKERSKLLLKDRMREKEAIFAVHCCIDFDQRGCITFEEWDKLWEAIHGRSHSNNKEKSDQLFQEFTASSYNVMDIYEFFEACELALCLRETQNSYICNPACWQKLRNFLNTKLHLKAFVKSRGFELFIFVIILLNVAVLIIGEIVKDEKAVKVCEDIDFYFVFIYLVEVILKIVGLGPVDYFSDPWNKMDFSLVLTSLVIQTTISFLKVAKYPSTFKALRSTSQTRKARSVKMLKGFRSIKACRVLSVITSPFKRIKTMIYKVYLNIATINTMVSIMLIIIYIFAIIGMECFHPNAGNITNSYYEPDSYGDFSSFSMSLIALFQVLTQSSWHSLAFHFADNFDYTGTLIYFIIFHLIQVIILLNLTSGLIWEVFTIVPSDEILDEVEGEFDEEEPSPTASQESPRKKRRKSTRKSVLFKIEEAREAQRPIDRKGGVNEMDAIPEVSVSDELTESEEDDAQNHTSTGSNLQAMAKKLGSDLNSKLLLRAALLKDSNVDTIREREVNEIKSKYRMSFTDKFNFIPKEKKNYTKQISPVLIGLLRIFRKTTLYSKLISSLNKAISKINYELPKYTTILMLNEVELRTEEGIDIKLYSPFYEEEQNMPLESTSLLTHLLSYNSSYGNSYIMQNFLDELDTIKRSTYSRQEIRHKKELFRELIEITNSLNSKFSDLQPRGLDLDILVETMEQNEETLDTSYFDEKQEIKNLNYLHRAILPEKKCQMVLRRIYFICLKPNNFAGFVKQITLETEPHEEIDVKVLRGLVQDMKDMFIPYSSRILLALTDYYNIAVLNQDSISYSKLRPTLSFNPSLLQDDENSGSFREDEENEFFTMGSAFNLSRTEV